MICPASNQFGRLDCNRSYSDDGEDDDEEADFHWVIYLGVGFWKTVATANDPKLSDRRVRRGICMAGGKAAAEAGAVAHGTVRCNPWLAVADSWVSLIRSSSSS